jgi:putative glutamine amidotransferase
MRKPLIGITPQYDYEHDRVRVDAHYEEALLACGALPVLLPLAQDAADIDTLAQEFDGFLFSGGPDPLPLLYGETTIPRCGRIDCRRDTLEFALMRRAATLGKPVLGICRGIQILCAALGGTLWQDIPSQVPGAVLHEQEDPYDSGVHEVTIEPGTLLADIVGIKPLLVNSIHHQAVHTLPDCLTAAAHTPDGLVEALCGKSSAFVLGVQWHPELLFRVQPQAQAIFHAFVDACAQKVQ